MRKLLFVFFCFALLLGCKEQTSKKQETNVGKYNYSISNAYQYDTLTLFARYKECGEWGGHTELFKIYQKEKNEIWADYKKDTVYCNEERVHKLIYTRTIKLTQESQELVIQYIHDVVNKNFQPNEIISNAGEYYSIISSDSSLVISYYTIHYDGFDKLRDRITH